MAVSSSCSSEPVRLLRVNIQHGRVSTALLCRRLRELDINISLMPEPWAYQGKIRGMGKAGGSLYHCTSGARLRVCIHAKNVDATPLPGFCHRDLVAVKIKEVDDTKGNTRDVIVIPLTSHTKHRTLHESSNNRRSHVVFLETNRKRQRLAFIRFLLEGNSYAEDSKYRYPRATRWNLYEKELKERFGTMPSRYGSDSEIETFANCLNSVILSSYEANSPLKKVDKAGKTPWWNSQIEFHRKTKKSANFSIKPNGQNNPHSGKIISQREYKKSIRIAQRDTWRTYCYKHITRGSKTQQGPIQRPGSEAGGVLPARRRLYCLGWGDTPTHALTPFSRQ
ncbi:hypothetical protein JTB14_008460 [Gonioctena quinquepunctata]|nr:hypothetical protein JTB14_008460 [Gonioctena quinquepunctata]